MNYYSTLYIMKLIKLTEILNSEGMILGLFEDNHQNYYLKSFIKPGGGYITYKVSKVALKNFYDNKCTIEDLLRISKSILISFEFRKESQTSAKEDFYGKLHCGNFKILQFSKGNIIARPLLD